MNDDGIKTDDPVGQHTLEVIAGAGHFNHWLYSRFSHLLKGNILEIGSGIGNLSQIVLDEGHRLTLSDYNPAYCEALKQKFANHPQADDILQIDLADPDFENTYAALHEKFDSIFLLNVIEHIKDDRKAVKHCRYLLKPGGHLVLLAPAYQWLYCGLDKALGHYRRYTRKKMSDLILQHQFEVIQKEYFNFLGIFGWLVSGKILRNKVLGKGEMSIFDKLVKPARLLDTIVARKTGLSVIVAGKK